MTEREKMLRGELYDSSDNELEQLRLHARKLARRYNLIDARGTGADIAGIIAGDRGASVFTGTGLFRLWMSHFLRKR